MAGIPRDDWRTVMVWLHDLLRHQAPKGDPTFLIAVAGLIRGYYERRAWSRSDAQLVAITCYRLFMGFSEGLDYSHAEIARLCGWAFTAREVARYQREVWRALDYNIAACIRDYVSYHSSDNLSLAA